MAKEEYLAQPPSACCFTGKIHTGEPRGAMEEVIGVPTYIARPAAATANGHIVLYFPDVWGISNNAKLVMDGFAEAGYLALGMDYFRGDPISKYRDAEGGVPEDFDRVAWRTKHFTFATENVPKWAEAVCTEYGNDKTKYACTGYCFGAPFVCTLLATDGIVSAGAFAHPSLLKEEHFRAIKQPLLLSCAENDQAFNTESRRKAVDILREDKKPYSVQVFSGVSHGFAVKGDPEDPYQRWCKEQSLRGMIDWFDMWLVRS